MTVMSHHCPANRGLFFSLCLVSLFFCFALSMKERIVLFVVIFFFFFFFFFFAVFFLVCFVGVFLVCAGLGGRRSAF